MVTRVQTRKKYKICSRVISRGPVDKYSQSDSKILFITKQNKSVSQGKSLCGEALGPLQLRAILALSLPGFSVQIKH